MGLTTFFKIKKKKNLQIWQKAEEKGVWNHGGNSKNKVAQTST